MTALSPNPEMPLTDEPGLAAGHETDLHAVLAAWNSATDRLQQTHASLRTEVRRLTEELAAKNRELARKNRLADLGQMASHIAHEVRNSLVPLTLYLSLLRRRARADDGTLDILDKVEAGFTALEVTVTDLLQFTHDRDPVWRPFDLHRVVADACDGLRPQLDAQDVGVELDVPRGLIITADQEMIRRALLNLLLNAVDAMPEGGQIVITSWRGRGGLEIEVADSGPGIHNDLREQIFQPFFTTKSGGTGLGLAIVQRIAEAHRGSVFAHNCPEGGAAFTLRIPQRATEAAA